MEKMKIGFNSAVFSESTNSYGDDNLIYNPRSRIFICDASDIGLRPGQVPKKVVVRDIKNNKTVNFEYLSTDIEFEEISGWRYKSIDGKFETTLLIIND